jgi:hypothetical protein
LEFGGNHLVVEDVEQDHPILESLSLIQPRAPSVGSEPLRKVDTPRVEFRWHPALGLDVLQAADPVHPLPE